MIKELLDQRADVAIADLTITYNREQVVDFTMPFMNLGISVLYRKPIKQPPNLFSFLSPLSLDVWCYMAVRAHKRLVYCVISSVSYPSVSADRLPRRFSAAFHPGEVNTSLSDFIIEPLPRIPAKCS